MTAENLLHYLQDPQRLYDISYQELKSMVAQYPFCQNLRYLLVYKSKIDRHKNYPKDLELAATYSIDRTLLHQQIELDKYKLDKGNEHLVFTEDVLELKELEQLEKTLEEKTIGVMLAEDNFEFIETPNVPPKAVEIPIPEFIETETLTEEVLAETEAPLVEPIVETPVQESVLETAETLPELEASPIVEPPVELESAADIPLEITNEEQYEIEGEESIRSKAEESSEKERDTLIDRILNEWLPPLPDEAKEKPTIKEDKIVAFEDFFEGEKEDTEAIEMGEKASDLGMDEVEEFDHEPMPEEVEETANQAVSDHAIAPTLPFNLPETKKEKALDESPLEEADNESELEEPKILIPEELIEDEMAEYVEEAFDYGGYPVKEEAPAANDNKSDQQPMPKQSFSSWLKNFKANKKDIPFRITAEEETWRAPIAPPILREPVQQEPAPTEESVSEELERNTQIKKLLKANKKKTIKKSKKKKKKKETEKKSVGKDLANQSLLESEEIISQTLADLLASQGYSEKAIKMYERLSLIFPEKSSFFAQKIKELNLFD